MARGLSQSIGVIHYISRHMRTKKIQRVSESRSKGTFYGSKLLRGEEIQNFKNKFLKTTI